MRLLRRLLPLFAVFLLVGTVLLLQAPQTASADERDFYLTDASPYIIEELYVAPSGSYNWGYDLMDFYEDDFLLPGETMLLHFTRYDPGYCLYDLRMVNDFGGESYLYGVNLCLITNVRYG
jgi:hypothetical protein